MTNKIEYIAVGASTGDILFRGKDDTSLIRQINQRFPLPIRGLPRGPLLPESIWLYAIDPETGQRI